MKVMVMVKASKQSEAGEMPDTDLLTAMGNFNAELAKAGILLSGDGLTPSSQGFRVRFSGTNRTVIDGPFSETKELIAGFWIWKVNSLQEAIEWVKRCPNPMREESDIEIRRIFEMEDFGPALTPELIAQDAQTRKAERANALAPRFEQGTAMTFAGLSETFTLATRSQIPALWERFVPHIGNIPGQIGKQAYGVCSNVQPDCSFDYLAAVQVQDTKSLPPEFKQISVTPRRYAVFTHTESVATFPETVEAVWSVWLPKSGLQAADAPCVEVYSEDFCPNTNQGTIELWVPLQN